MLLEEIFKGATEGGVGGIFKGVKDLITTFKADPLEVMKLQSAITTAEQQYELSLVQAQTKINEIEAASQDKFAARWRPALGWICVGGFGYQMMLSPIMQSIINFWYPDFRMDKLEVETLMTLLFGMLGLGAYRSFEKFNGVSK
jgi:hypothetical protein